MSFLLKVALNCIKIAIKCYLSWVRARHFFLSPPEVTSPVLPDSIPPNCIHLSLIITPSAVPHCHRLHVLLSLTIMPGCFLIYLICLFTHFSSLCLLSDVGMFHIISQMSAWKLCPACSLDFPCLCLLSFWFSPSGVVWFVFYFLLFEE